ncbi:MAG: TorF family putative porin [Lysobacterales bacterium]
MNTTKWVCATLILTAVTATADAQEAAGPHNFLFTGALVSDYAFRGVSQTQEDPALQASFDYTHESGFYAGVWGSNVDFTASGAPSDGADVEIDTYLGWRFPLGERIAADIQVIRYNYPGTNSGIDYDYNEFIGKLTFDWLTAGVGWSNDVFGSGESAPYWFASGAWTLPREFALSAGIAYYDLDNVFADGYLDYSVGITRQFGFFKVGLAYVGTDDNGKEIFGDLGGDRVIASIGFTYD